MTERKALTRTQIILICQRQAQGLILCGCGCGEPLEPTGEGVIDEHELPRKLSATGHEGERDVLENRALLRKPCAMEKTRTDLGMIAKARAQGGETGQYARRQKRGEGSIKSNPEIPSRPFDNRLTKSVNGKVRARKASVSND